MAQSRPVSVVVACGGGVATSSIAASKVIDVAKKAGVEISLIKCNIAEVYSRIGKHDIILTTGKYEFPEGAQHCLCAFSLVTGINEAPTRAKLTEWLQELAATK